MYYNFYAAKVNFYRAILICLILTLVAAFLAQNKTLVSAGDKTIVAASGTTTTTLAVDPLVPEVATTLVVQVTTTFLPVETTVAALPNPCIYDNTNRYTIKAGDALYTIADLYNTSIYDVVGCNQWEDTLGHLLLPGDEIFLPPSAHLTVVTTTTTAPLPPVVTPVITQPAPVVTQPATTTPSSDGRRTHPGCWWEPTIRSAFASAGASVNTQDFFVFVAWRESRCEQTAHNGNRSTGDNSYGLFQINLLPNALGPLMSSWGYDAGNLLNGFTNVQAAVRLWQYCGQGPWIRPYSCNYN